MLAPKTRTSTSAEILQRFCRARDGVVRYAIEPAYLDLLEKLGNPQKKLPPVMHVAGTNGKGSTCAFLRSILEAAGKRVHVYTSPHLVYFHERIRIAGKLIEESELAEILEQCERLSDPGQVSDFEAATAAAFVAFARHPADAVILEVGMGGRLDATNVIEKSAATLIARLSYDHCKYLGSTLTEIAREKAGIMREGIPCFTAPQPQEESLSALQSAAAAIGADLKIGGRDWNVTLLENGFRYSDATRSLDLPRPNLTGDHQLWNAGLAIAALPALPFPLSHNAIAEGVQKAEWPARLQNIATGKLTDLIPANWDLWLDGGHNDSAGEVLAMQMKQWAKTAPEKPLHLIFGMLTTKDPHGFIGRLKPYIAGLTTLSIPDEYLSFSAEELALRCREAGIKTIRTAKNLEEALKNVPSAPSGRILICGSLYLAGYVLKQNGADK